MNLNKDEVIYVVADTPNYYETAMGIERVYIEEDSYVLLTRLLTLKDVSGTVVELGTGTGIQLIALAKTFPGIKKAIGFEVDKRALNISLFNACLNGVEDRMEILNDKEELRNKLRQTSFSLAISNPPFMAIPEKIRISRKHRKFMPSFVRIERTLTGYKIDLRSLYPKSGWGGSDGLTITREFLNILEEFMGQYSKIFIYSQFAGRLFGSRGARQYRLKIEELMQANYKTLNFQFEFIPDSEYSILSLDHWTGNISKNIKAILEQDTVFRNLPEMEKNSFLWDLDNKIWTYLRIRRITHFFAGFAIITKDNRFSGKSSLRNSRFWRRCI